MNFETFVSTAVQHLWRDGISIHLHQKPRVDGCGGWFDTNIGNKEFVVACKSPHAKELFVHEYCHYAQWKEDPRAFSRIVNSSSKVFDWVNGKEFGRGIISRAFKDVIRLEYDCECRAVELIKANDFDIDLENYIRGANAYILFYHAVRRHRAWCKGTRSPYSPKIRALMHSTLKDILYYLDESNVSAELHSLYKQTL